MNDFLARSPCFNNAERVLLFPIASLFLFDRLTGSSDRIACEPRSIVTPPDREKRSIV
jgi:hypothetical protein